jgi:hypothetical protein
MLPGGTIDYPSWSARQSHKLAAGHCKPDRRKKMIRENKIISLAVIGLVIGGIVGVMLNSEQFNAVAFIAFGGVIGFLAGWIWNSRSGGSEE